MSVNNELMASFFKRPVQLMEVLGISPYKRKTFALILLAAFNTIAIFTGAMTEMTFSFIQFRKKDVIKGLDSFGPAIVKTVTTLKILYLWNRSKLFRNVIKECHELIFYEKDITKDERKDVIKVKNFKLAEKFCILTLLLAMFTNISFSCRPFVIMLSNHLNDRKVEKLMPFNA